MKYSIIVPTYNHCDDLLRPCIESIQRNSNIADYQLVVVANGCQDRTRQYLDQLSSYYSDQGLSENLAIHWSDQPLGYAGAINAGLLLARADLIVLLNNDVIVLDQPRNLWLQQLESVFDHDVNAGISCVVKGTCSVVEHDFAIFFCVMLHRKLVNAIGPLCLDYGIGGGEDIDYSLRAERAGFAVTECTGSRWNSNLRQFSSSVLIYHRGSATMHDRQLVADYQQLVEQNQRILAAKFNPDWLLSQGLDMKGLELVRLQSPHLYQEIVQENYYDFSRSQLEGRTVIDLGANIGMASFWAAELGAQQVIAVEATGDCFRRLCSNVRASQLCNITVLHRAVHSVSDLELPISVNVSEGANSLHNTTQAARVELVRTITLPELIARAGPGPIVIKSDCEGAEFDLFMTATAPDLEQVESIALEVHSDLHPVYRKRQDLEQRLTELGFKPTLIQPMYYYQWDQNGQVVLHSELPFCRQKWQKVA